MTPVMMTMVVFPCNTDISDDDDDDDDDDDGDDISIQ